MAGAPCVLGEGARADTVRHLTEFAQRIHALSVQPARQRAGATCQAVAVVSNKFGNVGAGRVRARWPTCQRTTRTPRVLWAVFLAA